ncbi:hypothetical protein U1Q18_042333 [Sarracenia purpurea var. burkii]
MEITSGRLLPSLANSRCHSFVDLFARNAVITPQKHPRHKFCQKTPLNGLVELRSAKRTRHHVHLPSYFTYATDSSLENRSTLAEYHLRRRGEAQELHRRTTAVASHTLISGTTKIKKKNKKRHRLRCQDIVIGSREQVRSA